MILLRKISTYLALIGLILMFILWKIVTTPYDPVPHVVEPASNPYLNTIAASGIIESIDRNRVVGPPEDGLVMDIYVHVDENVKKGDPLFLLDDRTLRANLLVQRANVDVAKATLNRLMDQLGRLKGVKDERAVSVDEVNTKENDVTVAKAELIAAQAAVEQTKKLIERMTVRAPMDGTILQSNIRPGEIVTKSTNAILMGDLSHLQIRADVDEQNASRINPRAPATAFPKNNTTLAIPLRFERVEPYVIPKKSLTGASDERVDTRVLQVLYSFDSPKDFQVYVGQQVDVFIEKEQP